MSRDAFRQGDRNAVARHPRPRVVRRRAGAAVRFAIAVHGTRGDIEPAAAAALELRRRGHDVAVAVPPNLVPFVEALGLAPVRAYGVDSQQQLEAEVFGKSWQLRNPLTALHQLREYLAQGWAQMSATLLDLADGADLILTGTTYQEVAANVAERLELPLAALHYFPFRANTQIVPRPLPRRLVRSAWPAAESLHWRLIKRAEDEQRRALGLPPARVRAVRRIVEGGALEIQAYDRVFFPGLDREWSGRRPIIGALTLQLDTPQDAETAAWIAAGTPPIYFGFGSMPVQSPEAALEMITTVSAELGERALICAGAWKLGTADPGVTASGDVRIVRAANHAAVFPNCRALVHHGGAGTTAAGLRAGVPTVVLWVGAEQPIWADRVRRLGVGAAQRFTAATADSLWAGLRSALKPDCRSRAQRAAASMTAPGVSAAAAADLLEAHARHGRVPVRQSHR